VAAGQIELVRPGGGRNYELRRGDEVIGTVHRRGMLRPRYTARFGEVEWRFEKPHGAMRVLDDGSGQEVARLDVGDDAIRLIAEDERRADPAPTLHGLGGESSFDGADDAPLVTLTHLGGWKDTIATIEPRAPWPSPDPEAGLTLAIAVLVVRLVAERDTKSAQSFSAG
jgi:hypothetical protein